MTRIERAASRAEEVARKYQVPRSGVIWAGGNSFVIVKNGVEIRVFYP